MFKEANMYSGIIEAISGPKLIVPICLVRLLGGNLDAAAVLCLAAWLSSCKRDGWFDLPQKTSTNGKGGGLFQEIGSWHEALGLSQDRQVAARKMLRNLGLLEEKLKGIPARMHYRVDGQRFCQFLAGVEPASRETTPDTGLSGSKMREDDETCLPSSEKQVEEKSPCKTRESHKAIPNHEPKDLPKQPLPPKSAPCRGGNHNHDMLPDVMGLHLQQLRADSTLSLISDKQLCTAVTGLEPALAQRVMDELVARVREGREGSGKPVQQNGWPLLKYLARTAREGGLQVTPGGRKIVQERERQQAQNQKATNDAPVNKAAGLKAARNLKAALHNNAARQGR